MITAFFQYIDRRLESFTQRKYWQILLVLGCVLGIYILTTPDIEKLLIYFKSEYWDAFRYKTEHLLGPLPFDPRSHAAKKIFRITVPLIASVLHLSNLMVLILQYLVGVLLLWFMLQLFRHVTENNKLSVVLLIGFAAIYAGKAAFCDIFTWFDEFAFLFIGIALLSRNIWVIALMVIAACFTDERALVATGFVLIYHGLRYLLFNEKVYLRASVAVVAGVIISVGLRLYLQGAYNMHTPSDGANFDVLVTRMDYIALSVWTGLEGFWIMVIAALGILLYKRKYLAALVWFGNMFVITLMSQMVFDRTRSMSYIFPSIIIALMIMKKYMDDKEFYNTAMVSAGVSILFPAYFVVTDWMPATYWYKPFFIYLFDYWLMHRR